MMGQGWECTRIESFPWSGKYTKGCGRVRCNKVQEVIIFLQRGGGYPLGESVVKKPRSGQLRGERKRVLLRVAAQERRRRQKTTPSANRPARAA